MDRGGREAADEARPAQHTAPTSRPKDVCNWLVHKCNVAAANGVESLPAVSDHAAAGRMF